MSQQLEGEQLLRIHGCEVYEVAGQHQQRIVQDAALNVTVVADVIHLQVGTLHWRLAPEVMVLKSAKGAYTFAVSSGSTFYLVRLPASTPEPDEALFEEVLEASTSFQVGLSGVTADSIEASITDVANRLVEQQQPAGAVSAAPAPPKEAKSAATRIHEGSAKAQAAAAAAAVFACQRIAALSDSMAARLTPADRPVKINPFIKGVLERVARHSSQAAAGVLSVAHELPARVADTLVRRLGGRASLVPGELAAGQPPASRMGAAREVAAASVLAAVDVYAAMAEAAETVVHTGGAAASQLVTHKYGDDAGQAAGSVASLAKSATKVLRAKRTGMTTVATRIARHTAVGLARSPASAVSPVT
ncbi:hypothetical protein WJX81_007435 [Elliptochloris bilobata]|uniref:Senescence domain-containing protein n=1 Tax=Elliptochloris bilobata TaxID=381761 RepID=A0AAW1S0Q5_9CHLO